LASLSEVNNFLEGLVDNCCGGTGSPQIVFNEDNDFPTVNGGNVGGTLQHLQALSHIDEVCDGLAAESYVLHPEIEEGEVRRTLHSVELDILRNLGYIVNETNDTQGACFVYAYEDNYNNIRLIPGQSIIVPFSFLLANDIFSTGSLSISYNSSLTLGSAFVTVTPIDTNGDSENDAFQITALPLTPNDPAESVHIRYEIEIEECEGKCSDANLVITILGMTNTIPDCSNVDYCDNLICNGDFEAFTPTLEYFWTEAGLDPFFFSIDGYPQGNNSPDVAFEGANSATNTNQFIRLQTNESFYLPLENPIMPGCTLSLGFKAAGITIDQILTSEQPPCFVSDYIDACTSNYGELCILDGEPTASYSPHCISFGTIDPPGSGSMGQDVNGLIYYPLADNPWQGFNIQWINTTSESINWVIFDGCNNVRIDDIVATQSCPATVTIETEETDICNLGVTEICFDVCVDDLVEGTEVELAATIELPEGFVVTSGSAITTLTFSENECQTICLSIMNTEDFFEEEFNLPIEVSQCGEILEEAELPVVVIDCAFSCADCVGTKVIGEPTETTLLSEVIGTDPGELPENVANGIEICIAGTFVIDEHYNFINCTVFILPGARIVIKEDLAPSILGTQLLGCDAMWRGIEMEETAQIKMSGSVIRDAQYALYLHPVPVASHEVFTTTGGTVANNCFVNNFVSLFTPHVTGGGRVSLLFADNELFQTETVLKPPYSGQTSAPESLSAQDDHALAGIVLNNLKGFSLYRNKFQELTAGIVGNGTVLKVEGNEFRKILPYDDEYPTFQARGVGITFNSPGGTNTIATTMIFRVA